MNGESTTLTAGETTTLLDTAGLLPTTTEIIWLGANEAPEEAPEELTYIPVDIEYRESSDGDTSTFLISTGNEDRYKSIIEAKGIDLKSFRKNPIVKFDHGFDSVRGELPIARAISIVRKDDGILATIKWWTDEFSQNVREMVKAGFLNAASIGFIPIKSERRDNGDETSTLVYKKVELLEFSIVSVPANRQSLVQQRGVQPSWLRDITNKIDGLSQEVRAMRAGTLIPGTVEMTAEEYQATTRFVEESPVEAKAEAVPGGRSDSPESVAEAKADATAEPVPEQPSEKAEGRLIQMRMSDMLALQRETVQAARDAAIQELNRKLGRA